MRPDDQKQTDSRAGGHGGRPSLDDIFVWVIPMALVALAAVFVALPSDVRIPIGGSPAVDPVLFAPGPFRGAMREAVTLVGGFEQKCNSCHRLFESREPTAVELSQHTHLRHDHGMNDRCFNCHDNADREKLVLHDGTLIPVSEAPRLCGQCHGPTYRDWEMGIHGKTTGSWDKSTGLQERLRCNECHDPHAPAFPQFAPLPGPNTLRMPDRRAGEHVSPASESPLQRWLLAPGGTEDSGAGPDREDE